MGHWLPESPPGVPSLPSQAVALQPTFATFSDAAGLHLIDTNEHLVEASSRFGKLLQFRVYGILGRPVDSARLLLYRACLASRGFHLLPLNIYFFSLCTLAIPPSTMLNLLTQTDAKRASTIIPLEML